jgi:hypothetical protein
VNAPKGRKFTRTFGIDRENNITPCGSGEQIDPPAGETEVFGSQQELAALAEKWPTARLVGIWNCLPGVEPVERFTSRRVAVARIWKAIQSLGPVEGAPAHRTAAKKQAAHKKAPRAENTRAAGQTKTARVIALLERPQGATLKAIMRATGWLTHSVRGFISGHLKKKLGLKVRSSVREGERVYSIKRRS